MTQDSSAQNPPDLPTPAPVLVVGGTGFLGRKVVAALLERGKPVRALVRPGSDASALERLGVEIVRGDMMDPATLGPAFAGVDAVVTSAAGYTRRRKTDTPETDTVGNRNLVDAAKTAGVRRFVLTSILRSDEATYVPHFFNKVLVERYLAEQGVPFVSLRPGAFFDQMMDGLPLGPRRGFVVTVGRADVPFTFVLTEDVAAALADLVDAPIRDGEHVDLGWDRPVAQRDIPALASRALGRKVRRLSIPAAVLDPALGVLGRFQELAADMRQMLRFFASGRYVADTTRQRELFGVVPTAEDAVARWAATKPDA